MLASINDVTEQRVIELVKVTVEDITPEGMNVVEIAGVDEYRYGTAAIVL